MIMSATMYIAISLVNISMLGIGIAVGVLVVIGVGTLVIKLCFRWRPCIALTIEVVKTLSMIIQEKPSVLMFSLLISILSLVWSLCVFGTALAISGGQIGWGPSILFFVVFFWGVQTAYYYKFTVLSGVFGRLYHKQDSTAPLFASVKAASTSSFGSISKAACIVGLRRTVQMREWALVQVAMRGTSFYDSTKITF